MEVLSDWGVMEVLFDWRNNPDNLVKFGGSVGWMDNYCIVCMTPVPNDINGKPSVRNSYICDKCKKKEQRS